MHCVFKKPREDAVTGVPNDNFDTQDVYQASTNYVAMNPEEFQEFKREGSGWTLDHVVKVEDYTATYEPLANFSFILLSLDLLSTSKTTATIASYDT